MPPGEAPLQLSGVWGEELDDEPEEQIAGVCGGGGDGIRARRVIPSSSNISTHIGSVLSVASAAPAKPATQVFPVRHRRRSEALEWRRVTYVVAAVVAELQSEVFFLQQLQMSTHFVEEVTT